MSTCCNRDWSFSGWCGRGLALGACSCGFLFSYSYIGITRAGRYPAGARRSTYTSSPDTLVCKPRHCFHFIPSWAAFSSVCSSACTCCFRLNSLSTTIPIPRAKTFLLKLSSVALGHFSASAIGLHRPLRHHHSPQTDGHGGTCAGRHGSQTMLRLCQLTVT